MAMKMAATMPTAVACMICCFWAALARISAGTRLILIIALCPILVASQGQADGHGERRSHLGGHVDRRFEESQRVEDGDRDLQLPRQVLREVLQPGRASHEHDASDGALRP